MIFVYYSGDDKGERAGWFTGVIDNAVLKFVLYNSKRHTEAFIWSSGYSEYKYVKKGGVVQGSAHETVPDDVVLNAVLSATKV